MQQAKRQVENLGIDAVKKQVDIEAAKIGIDQSKVDLVKSRIETDVAGNTSMRKAELDVISKKVAIEIETLNRDKGWYDFGIYKTLGLPTGQSLGMMEKQVY